MRGLTPHPLMTPMRPLALATEVDPIRDRTFLVDEPMVQPVRVGPPLAVSVAGGVKRGAISAEQAAKRLRDPDPYRAGAVRVFAEFIYAYQDHCKLGDQLRVSGEQAAADSPSIVAAVHPKATETLRKRAGSLRAFSSWFRSAGFVKTPPFHESVMFAYFGFLIEERAAPSRGLSVRQLLGFMGGVFGYEVSEALSSARVKGLSTRLRERRGILCQQSPLSVRMVRVLEETVLSEGPDEDKAIAGLALFGLFARCRVGDLRRCEVEPVMDLAPDASSGFAETMLDKHRTARPGHRQLLPAVAPAFGVLGRDWASPWLAARKRLGLCARSSGTLVQAPLIGGGWSEAPLRTVEFAGMMRGILIRAGIPQSALVRVGSQSLKVTTLSWAARHGFDRETRRMLGYHLKPGDRSMEAYSRDTQAGPLRKLSALIRDVAAGRFDPDATRSGQFARPPSSSCSSSGGRSESSEGPVDEVLAEPEVEVPVVLEKFVRNDKTKRVHILTETGELSCERAFPVSYSVLEELPADARLCRDCF